MINEQLAGKVPAFTNQEAATLARMMMAFFQEPGVEEDYQKWLKERESNQQ